MVRLDVGAGSLDEAKLARYRRYLGTAYRPSGYIAVELRTLPGVHVVGDLSVGLPFLNESVGEIICVHVLEHLKDLGAAMEELHRVLKPGGLLHVWVPHCFSPIAFGDSTHVRFFTYETLSQFDGSSPAAHYYRLHFEFLASRIQVFRRWYRPRLLDRLLEYVINLDQRRGERFLKVLPYKEWEVYSTLRKGEA